MTKGQGNLVLYFSNSMYEPCLGNVNCCPSEAWQPSERCLVKPSSLVNG